MLEETRFKNDSIRVKGQGDTSLPSLVLKEEFKSRAKGQVKNYSPIHMKQNAAEKTRARPAHGVDGLCECMR